MQQPYSESFWINQVVRNISIGWEKSSIPAVSLTRENAEALARQLNARLDVVGSRYIFRQIAGQ